MRRGRKAGQGNYDYGAIRRMASLGVSYSAIADAMGCSLRTVRRAVNCDNDYGVKLCKRPPTLQLSGDGDITERYRDLASAIVLLAVNDLREAVRHEVRTGKQSAEAASLAHWFTTPWAQMLCAACGVDAPSVPAAIRRQEAERMYKRLGA
jgi:hypothetical protein